MRILVQAATAAPGGSLTTLRRLLDAWPPSDDLLILAWRSSALNELRSLGLQVLEMPGRSTPEAIFTTRARIGATVSHFAPNVIWGQQYYLPGYREPQVVHHRNILRFTGSPSTPIDRLRDIVSARGLRRARSLVFNSQALLDAATERFGWLRDHDCHVVYNGVDPVPTGSDWPLEATTDALRILVPQSDAPHKRSEWIPTILTRLRGMDPQLSERIQFRVAGPGEHEPLMKAARQAGLEQQIHLLGFLARERMEAEYRNSDVVLITSRAESFCNPVIEAHSAGKRIVAPELPVLKELQGPLLHLVQAPNPDLMAEAVLQAIRAGRPSESSYKQAQDFAAQFASVRQARRLRAVLEAAA